jgi:glycosyltransferase involved in cell wall biosynthesis
VRVRKKSLSNARNVGLEQASGEIIAFPDDDCWYPDGLLPGVASWFATHSGYDILAVGAQDEKGIPSGNRWPQDQCDIRPYNSLRTTFSNSLFLKRASLPRRVVFDEKMLSSEETDYILHLLRLGLRGRFDRSLHICHSRRDMLSGTISLERAKRYGQGMGQLARRHSLYALWAGLMAYEFLRAAIVAVSGDLHGAKFCLAHAQGIVCGFLSPAPFPASARSLQAE